MDLKSFVINSIKKKILDNIMEKSFENVFTFYNKKKIIIFNTYKFKYSTVRYYSKLQTS